MKPGLAGILLAAGSGKRFGADKLTARLPDGQSVAVAAARNLRAAISRCVVVVKSLDSELARTLADMGFSVVVNRRPNRGMGSSIAAAVRATPDVQGWLIALADMPFIETQTVAEICRSFRTDRIVAPVYAGQRGHPVLFGRRFSAQLQALQGEKGARQLLRLHADSLRLVPTDDSGVVRDIDYPADLVGR